MIIFHLKMNKLCHRRAVMCFRSYRTWLSYRLTLSILFQSPHSHLSTEPKAVLNKRWAQTPQLSATSLCDRAHPPVSEVTQVLWGDGGSKILQWVSHLEPELDAVQGPLPPWFHTPPREDSQSISLPRGLGACGYWICSSLGHPHTPATSPWGQSLSGMCWEIEHLLMLHPRMQSIQRACPSLLMPWKPTRAGLTRGIEREKPVKINVFSFVGSKYVQRKQIHTSAH